MENKIYVDSEGKYLGEFSPVKITQIIPEDILDEKGQVTGQIDREFVTYQENPAIPEGAIEVDSRPVSGLQSYDFEAKGWKDNLKFLKEQKLKQLGDQVSSKIYQAYPQQKQINLANQALQKKLEDDPEIDPDYKAMNEFIAPITSKKDEIKKRINACRTEEELAQVEIDFEGEE